MCSLPLYRCLLVTVLSPSPISREPSVPELGRKGGVAVKIVQGGPGRLGQLTVINKENTGRPVPKATG